MQFFCSNFNNKLVEIRFDNLVKVTYNGDLFQVQLVLLAQPESWVPLGLQVPLASLDLLDLLDPLDQQEVKEFLAFQGRLD